MSISYSFIDVTAAINGPGGSFSIKEGTAEEGIKVSMRAAKNELLIAADGKSMHSLRADNSATITLTLLKNSPVNNLLTQMYNLQRQTGALWGQNNITITEPILGDVIVANEIAFGKQPDAVFAEKGGTNTWEFDAGKVMILLAQASN